MEQRLVTEEYPLFLPESVHPRSPGVHVSGIIRGIATEMGFLPYEIAEALTLTDVREITDPMALLRINIGLAWESHYIPNILSRYGVVDHPGEMDYDGVYMTHDGEDLSVIMSPRGRSYKYRIHEIKATYKSTATVGDMTSQWMWLAQLKSYCKAKDTDTALMHVLYLCGNYKFPIQPVREVREITFTQEELDDNWSLLHQYMDERLAEELQDAEDMQNGNRNYGT